MTDSAPMTREQIRGAFVPRIASHTCRQTGQTFRYQSIAEGPLAEIESYQSGSIERTDADGGSIINQSRFQEINRTVRRMVLRETLLDGDTPNRMYGDSDAELDAIGKEIDAADAAELFAVIAKHIGMEPETLKEMNTEIAAKNLLAILSRRFAVRLARETGWLDADAMLRTISRQTFTEQYALHLIQTNGYRTTEAPAKPTRKRTEADEDRWMRQMCGA